jgi:hypothetical protein
MTNTNTCPTVLYHYTTQAGFIGILESDSIWATKIHYLNDSSEYELALAIGRDVLSGLLKSEPNEQRQEKITCLLENLDTIESMNICVCSFSEHGDLLSQWRAYGGNAGSYALGFHTAHILEQAKEQHFTLVKCVYDEQQQRALVERLVEESLQQDFNVFHSHIDPKDPWTIIALLTGGDFAMKFAQLAPSIKSKEFHEESEWRLVSSRAIDVQRMSFRPGRSMLTPFVPFSLSARKNSYLACVTVGPTPHTRLAKLSTQSLLAHWNAAQEVKVHESSVPYRSW